MLIEYILVNMYYIFYKISFYTSYFVTLKYFIINVYFCTVHSSFIYSDSFIFVLLTEIINLILPNIGTLLLFSEMKLIILVKSLLYD
jgi:hypothetical protein